MNNKFSENLKKIRKDNNLSQEQLADKLDDYIEKEYSYLNEISILEEQINMYKNNN